MDFAKLGRKLAEKSSEAFSKHQHLLTGLAQGEIRIPQDLLNAGIQRAASANPDVSHIELECREGTVRVSLNIRSLKLLEHAVVLDFRVEHFALNANEQHAQLRFEEGANPEARNWSASVASWFADASIDKLMSDPKRAADIASKTGGLVSLEWPLARLNLDRHDAIKLLKGIGILSKFEIAKCGVVPGSLVFPVTKVTN